MRALILRWTANHLPVSFRYCCKLSVGLCQILNTPVKLALVWNAILHYCRPSIEETAEICEEEVVAYSKIGVPCWHLLGRTKEKHPIPINLIRVEQRRADNAVTSKSRRFPISGAIPCLSIRQPPRSTQCSSLPTEMSAELPGCKKYSQDA
jgi:hypothetical protein